LKHNLRLKVLKKFYVPLF